METCVSATAGVGLVVRNCSADRGYPDKITIRDASPESGVKDFLRLGLGATSSDLAWNYGLPTVIKDNVAKGLSSAFIKFMNSGSARNLYVDGNTIQSAATEGEVFYFYGRFSSSIRADIHTNYLSEGSTEEALNGTWRRSAPSVYLEYNSSGPDKGYSDRGQDLPNASRKDEVGVIRQAIAPGGRILASINGGSRGIFIFCLRPSFGNWTNIGTASSIPANIRPTADGPGLTGTTDEDGTLSVGLSDTGGLWIENRLTNRNKSLCHHCTWLEAGASSGSH